MQSIRNSILQIASREDLPLVVKLTQDHQELKEGEIFVKVQDDPLGCYANSDDTKFILPFLVRKGLAEGFMKDMGY